MILETMKKKREKSTSILVMIKKTSYKLFIWIRKIRLGNSLKYLVAVENTFVTIGRKQKINTKAIFSEN